MPTISRFYGIVIMMYHNDRHAPHFHAKYGEYGALIAIDDGSIIAGKLPIRAYHLVLEWLAIHRLELLQTGSGQNAGRACYHRGFIMSEEIVYNAQYPELVSVRSVRLREGSVVYVTFTNGSARDVNLEPYLHGPLFEPIRQNPEFLAQVYVDPETETLTWPNGADIDPDVLYYEGNPPWSEAA